MKKTLAAIAVAALALNAPAALAQDPGPFAQGRTHFVASGGVGTAYRQSYLVLGVGLSYYLADGLSAGASLEAWSASNPGMYKVTPELRYVFYQTPLKPYVGAFYRRTYIDGLPDINSAGGRAGVLFTASRNAYVGVGLVYESYIDCRASVYRECSSTYPEMSFTIAF